MILLNIARAGRREPMHFTAVSSVAATFNFQVSAGLLGRVADNVGTGSAAALTLGASVSENPTVTIIPVEGEAFTKRLLSPMRDDVFLFLRQQGVEPTRMLRVLAQGYVDTSGEGRVNFRNNPKYKDQYIEFRRIVLHIGSLSLADAIQAHTIVYEEEIPAPHTTDSIAPGVTDTVIGALKEGYHWNPPKEGESPALTRVLRGKSIITNYKLSDLSNAQRRQLYKEAERLPEQGLLVDISPDSPGGEFPLHGYFQFRSLFQSLHFIARGIEAYPEFDVEKDPRTGQISINPAVTLAIQKTGDEPSNALLKIEHAGSWYWLPELPDGASDEAAWNQTSFLLLIALYNMTVTDVTQHARPTITIAK
jgi:hypothetical protein